MFNGVPDQFHQFIASSRTSLPIPLSFPLHGTSTPTSFTTFDPYPSSLHSHLLPQLHPQSPTNKAEGKEQHTILLSTNLELQRERSIDPWSNDEVLALLRIRSSMENWFPDFTWEHVSRKLAELGFKRSPEICKDKFEEETRSFNSISYSKNNRFFSELEEICHGENSQVSAENNQITEKVKGSEEEEEEEGEKMGQSLREDSRNVTETNPSEVGKLTKREKRKRKHKFDIFKGFCEDIVNKIMAQQEELHNKLIEDMVNRDEEKIAREEAWKKQEMERINKEIDIRAHEQAIAGDRQATIIEFLKKFTSTSSENSSLTSPTSPSQILPQTHNSTYQPTTQNSTSLTNQNNPMLPTSLTETLAPPNPSPDFFTNIPKLPSSSSTLPLASQKPNSAPKNPNSAPSEREDIGKRWPKDEVLALINMRCSFYSSGNEDKEGAKGSLWERISQGMLELGYRRSAKRCKEKWENINKYFRKTKDVNKKRSVDSRTCPYFHQLSSLYNQGTLMVPGDVSENRSVRPENHSGIPETAIRSTQGEGGSTDHANVLAVDGGKNVIQVLPAFNFEF